MTAVAHDLKPGFDQYLTFMLGDEEYGVSILQVQGIQGWDRVTADPQHAGLHPRRDQPARRHRADRGPAPPLRHARGASSARPPWSSSSRSRGSAASARSGWSSMRFPRSATCAPRTASRRRISARSVETDFVQGLVTVEERMVILLDIDRLVSEGLLGAMPAA